MAASAELLLAVLPIAAAALARHEQAHSQAEQRFWATIHDTAPAPVWQYFTSIEDECRAALALGALPGWLEQQHPAFDDVMGALERACYGWRGSNPAVIEYLPEDVSRLTYVQNDVVRWSLGRLGGRFAKTRQPVTGGVHYDEWARDMAARALLDWSGADAHAHWLEHDAFLVRWRVADTSDADVLERAGLHAAERQLLAAS